MAFERLDDEGRAYRFEGFAPEAFTFLRRLQKNNRREWFQPRKAEFEKLLREPMRALVAELGEKFAKKLPGATFDPRKAVFRIYRDTRFGEDKTPYKTHVAAHMSYRVPEGQSAAPGLYVHVEPGEVYVGAGLYTPSSTQLKAIRRAIDEESREFLRVVKSPALKKTFGEIGGKRLKRAPRGVHPEHPMLEWLKLTQFFVGLELPEKAAQSRSFLKVLEKKYSIALPWVQWLREKTA